MRIVLFSEYINEEFRFDRPDVSAALCLQILGMIKDELGECCKKTDELCDAAKTLAGMGEGSAHRGWGGSCSPLREL